MDILTSSRCYQHLACTGRCFIAGDLHGCPHLLSPILETLSFNPSDGDCCVLLGDLTDRGPASLDALALLEQPGFYSILGNHELMMLAAWEHEPLSHYSWCCNGGQWFYRLTEAEQVQVQARYEPILRSLPYAIRIDCASGLSVGLCHADPVFSDWQQLESALRATEISSVLLEQMVWSRERLALLEHGSLNQESAVIHHIDFCIMGHTPLKHTPVQYGNCLWIDGGAVFAAGNLTVMEASQPPRFYHQLHG